MVCEKCSLLKELYDGTSKSNRDYYIMTELFALLHGGDICNEDFVVPPKPGEGFYPCGAKYSNTQNGENTRPYAQCCTLWWSDTCYGIERKKEELEVLEPMIKDFINGSSPKSEERVMDLVCSFCQGLGEAIIEIKDESWSLKQFTCPSGHNYPPTAEINIDPYWTVEQIRNNSLPRTKNKEKE